MVVHNEEQNRRDRLSRSTSVFTPSPWATHLQSVWAAPVTAASVAAPTKAWATPLKTWGPKNTTTDFLSTVTGQASPSSTPSLTYSSNVSQISSKPSSSSKISTQQIISPARTTSCASCQHPSNSLKCLHHPSPVLGPVNVTLPVKFRLIPANDLPTPCIYPKYRQIQESPSSSGLSSPISSPSPCRSRKTSFADSWASESDMWVSTDEDTRSSSSSYTRRMRDSSGDSLGAIGDNYSPGLARSSDRPPISPGFRGLDLTREAAAIFKKGELTPLVPTIVLNPKAVPFKPPLGPVFNPTGGKLADVAHELFCRAYGICGYMREPHAELVKEFVSKTACSGRAVHACIYGTSYESLTHLRSMVENYPQRELAEIPKKMHQQRSTHTSDIKY